MAARWLNVIVGAWLMLGPWVLSTQAQPQARSNDFWLGLGVLVMALAAMAIPAARYVNTVFGLWLVISPFVLGITGAPRINDIICGVIVTLASLAPSRVTPVERLPPVARGPRPVSP